MNKTLLPIAIVVAAIIIAGALIYLNPFSGQGKVLPPQEVGEKVINYINDNILKGQATATLIDVVKEKNLYKVTLDVDGQEVISYATLDGAFLFPEPIELDTQPASETPETPPTESPQEPPQTEKPNAKLFIMSFCPYGNQAEEIMMPVVDLLDNKAEIEPHYVIYSNYGGGGPNYCADAENKYCSMHGIQELNQNVRELCVWKYQNSKFWDFLKEINKDCSSQNADTCWEGVAQNMGINVQKIKDCEQNEKLSLLEAELSLNKQYGVTGSPQLFINDVQYQGSRNSEAYKSAICSAFTDLPEECNQTLGSAGSAPTGGCE